MFDAPGTFGLVCFDFLTHRGEDSYYFSLINERFPNDPGQMTIDIRRTVIKKKLRSFFTTILVILIIVLVLFTNVYKEEIFKIDKVLLTVIIAALYILTILFNVIREYNYIYYSDDGEKIVFRYFSLSVFTQKKNSIEIPKRLFAGYMLEKSFMG